jgi:ATP-binding cassette, subfamily B (MDR/TAP), member 7
MQRGLIRTCVHYRGFSTSPKPNPTTKGHSGELAVLSRLSKYIWPPVGTPPPKDGDLDSKSIKTRVVTSVTLLFASKGLNISVPFIFKALVDSFTDSVTITEAASTTSTVASDVLANVASNPMVAYSPALIVIAYGLSRSTAAGFSELKNAIFATVAQRAIRQVTRNIFQHLLTLDMQFHMNRNTGQLAQVIDRGSRSINFALTALLFNVFPTILEVGLVGGILSYSLGFPYAVVATSTVAVYTIFTVKVSNWRIAIRKHMIAQEAKASGKVVDSLINYETVKLFQNEDHEVDATRH